jgi:hypothetical protein
MKASYYDFIKHLKISKRNIHLLSKNDIVFLHIGKNAGTQVKHLSEQINNIQSRIKILNFGHKCKLTDIPISTRYFFSVRDPITRFKSGFYSRKRKGQPRLYNEWSPEEEVAFTDFEHANDLAEALFRNDELGRKAFWAMMSIKHVRNHQVDWFANAGYFLLDRKPVHIIRQENFEFDFRNFMEKSGLISNSIKRVLIG